MDKSFLQRQNSTYREFPIPPKLKKFVLMLWSFRTRSTIRGKVTFSFMPEFTTSIIYIKTPGGKNNELMLYGPSFKKIKFEYEMQVEVTGIRLKPEVLLNLFNSIGPSDHKTLTILSGKQHHDLVDMLGRSRSPRTSLKLLGNYIMNNSTVSIIVNKHIKYVMNAILESHGNCRLEIIYDHLEIGKRQLQRLFKEYFGMSPKDFIKLVRIYNTTRELVKSGYDHFTVISELGYYDQSHYTREFKDLLGVSPAVFESRQRSLKLEKLIE